MILDTQGTRPLDVGSDGGLPTTGGVVPSGETMKPAGDARTQSASTIASLRSREVTHERRP